MTFEEFKKNILGADIENFTQEEIEGLFVFTFPFAEYALKKWKDVKATNASEVAA